MAERSRCRTAGRRGRNPPLTNQAIAKVTFAAAALLLGVGPLHATPKTPMADCYDATLDVILDTNEDVPGLTRRFSLPYPDAWLVDLGTGGKLLEQLPCQPEPVRASGLVGSGGWPSAKTKERLADSGVTLWQVRLSATDHSAWIAKDGVYVRPLDATKVVSQGIDVGAGYGRIIGSNLDAVGGRWLLPDAYRDPLGYRISIDCALLCDAYYRIFPTVSINYSFLVNDKNQRVDFVAVDRIVRSSLLDLVSE